jgi:FMN-binding domain
MKRAAWYVIAGTVAGFAGVLGLHGTAAPPSVVAQPKPTRSGPTHSGAAPAAAPGAKRKGPAQPTGPVRQVTGILEQYGYGELSVTVTVRGSQITDVSVPVLRTAEPYSQQLATQVLPTLKSEVLAAHSARINAVSGATYTSQAYADSIQSALDKLHIR